MTLQLSVTEAGSEMLKGDSQKVITKVGKQKEKAEVYQLTQELYSKISGSRSDGVMNPNFKCFIQTVVEQRSRKEIQQ